MNHNIVISSLTKVFPTPQGPHTVVKDFRAKIEEGEFVSLLGHSGCGKSTVLSIIAGLQRATIGGVIVEGTEVDEPGLDRGFVFQSPCLLPWLSAGNNVLLATAQAHPSMPSRKRADLARRYMDLCGVAEYWDQHPGELSQGTQQRISIARALSLEPRYLLLDEPFGMLDSITRAELQDMLLDVWERDRKTVILVTHDVDEALYLSDRVLLMTDGPEAHLGLDLHIPFPRPRGRFQVFADSKFPELRSRVMDFLESGVSVFPPSSSPEARQPIA
jgi:nitrate ABC transporter ATP-binding subunit